MNRDTTANTHGRYGARIVTPISCTRAPGFLRELRYTKTLIIAPLRKYSSNSPVRQRSILAVSSIIHRKSAVFLWKALSSSWEHCETKIKVFQKKDMPKVPLKTKQVKSRHNWSL